jgi:hypothetical protein
MLYINVSYIALFATKIRQEKYFLLFSHKPVHDRVARWHILKPKISKCVNFGGRC